MTELSVYHRVTVIEWRRVQVRSRCSKRFLRKLLAFPSLTAPRFANFFQIASHPVGGTRRCADTLRLCERRVAVHLLNPLELPAFLEQTNSTFVAQVMEMQNRSSGAGHVARERAD